jgi:phosphoglycolate phosphatase
MARTVVLFDIDLTLVNISVDRAVLAGALDAATGVPGLLDRIDYGGSTDRWIVKEAARVGGLPLDGLFERYIDAYTPLLAQALAALPSSASRGAAELVDALVARSDAVVGIATGNIRRNARLKLAHGGLASYFEPLRGGFGDAHEDRADIVRAGALECGHADGERLVVVGDTVRDVRAALAAGAVAIGVGTGHSTADELAAAGASVVLRDFVDRDAAMGAILGRDRQAD